jgi:bifunctional non-homologous end joining protein LigD
VDAPPTLRPMLTGTVGVPTPGGRWIVEPKWDGVRAMVTVQGDRMRMASRNGNDITAAYPELAPPPPALAGHAAVLDGEVIAIGPAGHPEFGLLQRRMHVRRPVRQLVEEVPVNLVLFDLLWIDGDLLIDRPHDERRARLDGLGIAEPPWMTSPLLDLEPGPELFDLCRHLGLEGFMVKRADAAYLPGRRSDAWAKVKCTRRREFVVGGWMEGRKSRAGSLGSLALGVWDEGAGERRLLFVGMAGSGLSGADIEAFRRVLPEIQSARSPFDNPTPRGIKYLEPLIVTEVVFSEVTAAGTLRHPVIAGFRTDVDAADVVVDGELSELLRSPAP